MSEFIIGIILIFFWFVCVCIFFCLFCELWSTPHCHHLCFVVVKLQLKKQYAQLVIMVRKRYGEYYVQLKKNRFYIIEQIKQQIFQKPMYWANFGIPLIPPSSQNHQLQSHLSPPSISPPSPNNDQPPQRIALPSISPPSPDNHQPPQRIALPSISPPSPNNHQPPQPIALPSISSASPDNHQPPIRLTPQPSHVSPPSHDNNQQQSDLPSMTPDEIKKQRKLLVKQSQYQCSDCNRVFKRRATYFLHLNVEEGRYPCDFPNCIFNGTSPSNLRQHKRTHTNERPYGCQVCGQRFKQMAHFNVHVNSVHSNINNPQFYCEVCKVYLKTKRSFNKHRKTSKKHLYNVLINNSSN